jgi:hypothetical protein
MFWWLALVFSGSWSMWAAIGGGKSGGIKWGGCRISKYGFAPRGGQSAVEGTADAASAPIEHVGVAFMRSYT